MKDALGSVQTVLVLGGSSEIGAAIAAKLAAPRAATVILAGRHPDALEAAASEVRHHGAGRVETIPFDALDPASHETVIAAATQRAGDLDVVVVAFGLLGSPSPAETEIASAVEVAATNYVGVVSSGLAAARRLREQGHGTMVVLSSVAGQRVRKANFVYGSSKAGLDGFAQGLGDALAGSGVRVLVVRPGFVVGRMTAGLKPAPMATTPDAVADAVAHAVANDRDVVWVPAGLRIASAVIRHLPKALWRRIPT